MPDYTLKIYRREDPRTSPGRLVGSFAFVADDNEAAIAHAEATYAGELADCDYAFIGGQHGRIVWELARDGRPS
jgi:hypothetical protein